MVRVSRWLIPTVVALALWTASASAVHAQVIYSSYYPAPVAVVPATSFYVAPAPVVPAYYAAPAVSYYAPAPVVTSYYAPAAGVTTYRYGPWGRLRSVSSYYAPAPVVRYGFYP